MSKNYIAPVTKEKFGESYKAPESREPCGAQSVFKDTISAMDKLALGPYMWTISSAVDLRIREAGGMVEEVTGLTADEFIALPGAAGDISVPEDIEPMFGFLHYSLQYRRQFAIERRNQITISYYFRLLRNGEGKWAVLKLIEETEDSQGTPQYILSMIMDVSAIKQSGNVMMTMFDSQTRKSQIFESLSSSSGQIEMLPSITRRELEILGYIARGLSSKMIADVLKLSQKTVDNHRRNVLLKTNCSTSASAIALAMRYGLL